MNKKEYIKNYVTTFLASWAASNYGEDGANYYNHWLALHEPLKQATVLAEESWDNILENLPTIKESNFGELIEDE